MGNTKFTKEYFIKKFEAIPEGSWIPVTNDNNPYL